MNNPEVEHGSSWQKAGIIPLCLYTQGGGSYLRSSEAEGGGDSVRPLPVLQDQTPVLCQSQIMTRSEVTQPKGLPPADVAPTPAEELKKNQVHSIGLFFIIFTRDNIKECSDTKLLWAVN